MMARFVITQASESIYLSVFGGQLNPTMVQSASPVDGYIGLTVVESGRRLEAPAGVERAELENSVEDWTKSK